MALTDTSDNPIADLIIIGAGPTGLFASFYAGLRQMSVTLIDSLDVLGGQLITLYPEKYIYDVAGFPKVLAKDLARQLIEQGTQYNPTIRLGEQVRTLDYDAATRVYTITTSAGAHRGRAVLIAAGVGAFQPKKLPLPDAAQFEGRGLHYGVKSLDPFRDARVLIVGGGDSAVDWANTIAPIARALTLIHRRDVFRAHEESVTGLREGPAKVLPFYELKSIGGEDRVSSATIQNNRTKDEQTLAVDHVLVNIGFESSLGPLKDWGLDLEGASIKVGPMMQTNRPGVYGAGDIITYPGKLKLIATGFGEAAIAVNFAKHHLDPKASIFPGHSTNLRR